MTTTTTSSTARSTSRGRVHAAEEEFIKQIDELAARVTTAVSRLEIEIGAIKTRVNGFDRRITQETEARTAQIKALRLELAESNRVAREALATAKEALEFAQHHHHRFNTGLDWHTTKSYKVDLSLGTFDY